MNRFLVFAVAFVALVSVANAQDVKDAITGTMEINFVTRTPAGQTDGSPKIGAQDIYKLDLTVNGANKFVGQIARQPRIKQFKIRTIQQPRYDFTINLQVGKFGTVGQWVGPMTIDEKVGAFKLEGADDRVLRIMVDKGQTFTSPFGGEFYGKAEDKSKLAWDTIKRQVAGKTVEKKFQADPIRFQQVVLAKGPNPQKYPTASVSGELSFDRETSNYYAKGLTFNYTYDGKDYSDVVTGTIKWVEDPSRKTNGKGRYEFNLRFNEEKAQKPKTDDQAFANKSDDDLFFAVDSFIPSLNGNVEYQDSMTGDTVVASKVTYKLQSNKLTDQQVMNFAKMWILACGPTNDE